MIKLRTLEHPRLSDTWEYLCLICENRFFYQSGDLECGRCRNGDLDEVVPVYVEDDPRNDDLIGKAQYSAGD
jgi:hypothetical protein